MSIIPNININQEIKRVKNINYRLQGVICLVGGFPKVKAGINYYPTFEKAVAELGADGDNEAYNALKYCFYHDIEGVIVYNTSTASGESGTDVDTTITAEILTNALNQLKDVNFNLLCVATEMTDELIAVIDTDANNHFRDKKPYGYVLYVDRGSEDAFLTTSELIGAQCYIITPQKITVDGVSLTGAGTMGYWTGYLAVNNVDDSLTARQVDIDGVDVEFTFNTGDTGYELVDEGYFLIRKIDVIDNIFEVVKSENRNGLDLYMSRVRDYIVQELSLRLFLGDKNNPKTLDSISLECSRIYNMFVKDLQMCENINYVVERGSPEIVNVILNSVDFAGVIKEIDVYLTINIV